MGAMSHKCERYESEWSKCGSGGVSVGVMSHKRERYESEWSKCVKERKKESMCHVNRNTQMGAYHYVKHYISCQISLGILLNFFLTIVGLSK